MTVAPRTASAPAPGRLPGLCLVFAIGVATWLLGPVLAIVGAPVLALLTGIAARTALDRWGVGDRVAAGSGLAGRYLLQASIVVLGAGLSGATALRAALTSLPVMLGTLLLGLGAARPLGRLLRVADPVRTMVGAGTAICGASAIAAVAPVLAATEVEMAYAVSTIVAYNVVGAVVFPPIGHLLGLSQRAFGLWVGTAVNDTSSVVATGYAYGPAAGQHAVVVKLTRALMIVPVVLGIVALRKLRKLRKLTKPGDRRDDRVPTGRTRWRLVPTVLIFFVLAVVANSLGAIPATWQPALHQLAGLTVAAALAGLGLSTGLGALRAAGPRPFLLGGLLSLVVALSSLGLQALAGALY